MSSQLVQNVPRVPTSISPIKIDHPNPSPLKSTTAYSNSSIKMSVQSSPSPPPAQLYLNLDSSERLSSRPRSKRASKGRVFQCTGYPDCNMLFTRSEHLARHKRKHTGERPFTCPHCSKNFSRLDNLRQHKQTVHAYETMIAVAHIPEIKNGPSSPESEAAAAASASASATATAPAVPTSAPTSGATSSSSSITGVSSVSSAPPSTGPTGGEPHELANGAPILPPPQLHRQQHHMPNMFGKILSPPNGNGVQYQQQNEQNAQNGHQSPQNQQNNLQLHNQQHSQQHIQHLQLTPNNHTPTNPNHQIYQYHIQQAYYPQTQYVAHLQYYPPVSYVVPPPLPSAPLPATIPLFSSVSNSGPSTLMPLLRSLQLQLLVPQSATSTTPNNSSPASTSSNGNSNSTTESNGTAGSSPSLSQLQPQSAETLKLPTSEFRPKRRPRPLELRSSFMVSAPSLAETVKTPPTASSALTTPTPSSFASSLQVPSSVSTIHMHQDELHGLKSAPSTSSFSAAYSRTSIISPLSPLFHQLFHQVKQQPSSSLSVENKENIGSAAAFASSGTGTGVVLPPVATSFSPLHIPPIRSSKNWLSGVLNGSTSNDKTDDMVVDSVGHDNKANANKSANASDSVSNVAIKNELDGKSGVRDGKLSTATTNEVKVKGEDDKIEVDSQTDAKKSVQSLSAAANNGDSEKRLSIRNLLS